MRSLGTLVPPWGQGVSLSPARPEPSPHSAGARPRLEAAGPRGPVWSPGGKPPLRAWQPQAEDTAALWYPPPPPPEHPLGRLAWGQ